MEDDRGINRRGDVYKHNANEEVVPVGELPKLNENFAKKLKKIHGGLDGKIAHKDQRGGMYLPNTTRLRWSKPPFAVATYRHA